MTETICAPLSDTNSQAIQYEYKTNVQKIYISASFVQDFRNAMFEGRLIQIKVVVLPSAAKIPPALPKAAYTFDHQKVMKKRGHLIHYDNAAHHRSRISARVSPPVAIIVNRTTHATLRL